MMKGEPYHFLMLLFQKDRVGQLENLFLSYLNPEGRKLDILEISPLLRNSRRPRGQKLKGATTSVPPLVNQDHHKCRPEAQMLTCVRAKFS